MYILIALFIVSIFIPFFWIFFFGYIAWLFFTKKAKRTIIMRNAISNLISSGQTETLLPYIYYEAAQQYAVDCGANLSPYKNDPANDSLAFDVKADNNNSYSVFISKWHDGSTFLSIEKLSTKTTNVVNTDFSTQDLGREFSESILKHIKNRDQAQALVVQLLIHAESDYIQSYADKGISKVASNLGLNLSKYSVVFINFYIHQKDEFGSKENMFEEYQDNYDPRKNRAPALSGIDLFEAIAPFRLLTLKVPDPDKCLEIKFFAIDSILKKWKLYQL